LIYVAAEAGARIGSIDDLDDPATWMFIPRPIFNSECAIDACRDRDHFIRAILLHLGQAGFDADPGEMDKLIGGSWEKVEADQQSSRESVALEACGTMGSIADFDCEARALYTTAFVDEAGDCPHLCSVHGW